MNKFRMVFVVGYLALVAGTLAPGAKASEWDKRTIIHFSAPVEIPGAVLPAGTYAFRLFDSQSDRNIVQVFNKDENKLIATVMAIPDINLKPAGKTVINFEERAADAPPAIRAWFYPGWDTGLEFVYPKARAIELAKANQQHVPSMPAALATNVIQPATPSNMQAMKSAPVTAIQPSGKEVQLAEVHPPAQPQAPTTPVMPAMKHLPKTGSLLPAIGLLGILSLAGAFSLRLFSARMN